MSLQQLRQVSTKLRDLIIEYKVEPVSATDDSWETIVAHFRSLQNNYDTVNRTLQETQERANQLDNIIATLQKRVEELERQLVKPITDDRYRIVNEQIAMLQAEIQQKEQKLQEYDAETLTVANLLDELEQELKFTKLQLDKCNTSKNSLLNAKGQQSGTAVVLARQVSNPVQSAPRDVSPDRASEASDITMRSASPSASNALVIQRPGDLSMGMISAGPMSSNNPFSQGFREEEEEEEAEGPKEGEEEERLLTPGTKYSADFKVFDSLGRAGVLELIENNKESKRIDAWTKYHNHKNPIKAGKAGVKNERIKAVNAVFTDRNE
jgi:hypothetical protein